MARIGRNAVILSEDDIAAINKVNQVIDAFFKLDKLVKSMNEKEFSMLERSLMATKEELESMDKKAG